MFMASLDETPKHILSRFRHCDDELLNRMFADCRIEKYEPGHVLFMQDDPSDRLYGLLEGSVELSVCSFDGDKLVAGLQFSPSLIGEIGVLDGGPRTASVVCRSPCSIVSLTRKLVMERVESDPTLNRSLIALLCKRMRWINEELCDLTFLAVEARLAKRILYMADRVSDEAGWIEISQSELAQTVGATRESANKILHDWRNRGIIATRRGFIQVCDVHCLRKLALGRTSG